MTDNKALISELKEDITRYHNSPSAFFSKIISEKTSDELAIVYNYILENEKDILFLTQTVREIDRNRNPENLDTLIDFLMSKKEEDYCTSESSKNDFVALKILIVRAISNFRSEKSTPALLYCLNSRNENYKLRLSVAEALGKIGDKTAVDSLIRVVKNEEEKSVYVRESAAKALGMLGDLKAIEPFIMILQSKKSFLSKFTFLKEQIIESIGKLNCAQDRRVLEVLEESLQDESSQVRLNAIESLSNSDFYEADALIEGMLFDSDSDVSVGALISLYNMGGKRRIERALREVENFPIHLLGQAYELLDLEEEEDEE